MTKLEYLIFMGAAAVALVWMAWRVSELRAKHQQQARPIMYVEAKGLAGR